MNTNKLENYLFYPSFIFSLITTRGVLSKFILLLDYPVLIGFRPGSIYSIILSRSFKNPNTKRATHHSFENKLQLQPPIVLKWFCRYHDFSSHSRCKTTSHIQHSFNSKFKFFQNLMSITVIIRLQRRLKVCFVLFYALW